MNRWISNAGNDGQLLAGNDSTNVFKNWCKHNSMHPMRTCLSPALKH